MGAGGGGCVRGETRRLGEDRRVNDSVNSEQSTVNRKSVNSQRSTVNSTCSWGPVSARRAFPVDRSLLTLFSGPE
jgi:hypothetical protein